MWMERVKWRFISVVHTTKAERRNSDWTFVRTKAPIFHKEFAEKESDFTAIADWIYEHKKYALWSEPDVLLWRNIIRRFEIMFEIRRKLGSLLEKGLFY